MTKKLYKSTTDKILCGVCAGFAEYFDMDPALVRIGWAVLSLCGGGGVIIYIVAAIVMPKKPQAQTPE